MQLEEHHAETLEDIERGGLFRGARLLVFRFLGRAKSDRMEQGEVEGPRHFFQLLVQSVEFCRVYRFFWRGDIARPFWTGGDFGVRHLAARLGKFRPEQRVFLLQFGLSLRIY